MNSSSVRGRMRAASGASAASSFEKSWSEAEIPVGRRGMAPIMMPGMEQNLRVPGPTPIPMEVREAQARPMIDHRGSEFAAMQRAISDGIAPLIGSSGEILLLTGSGSGALEATVVNTLSPGDRVLAVTIGAFGDRFAKIAEAYGAQVDRLAVIVDPRREDHGRRLLGRAGV